MTSTAVTYRQVTTTPQDGWLSSSLFAYSTEGVSHLSDWLRLTTYRNRWKQSLQTTIEEWGSCQEGVEIDPIAAQYALDFVKLLPEDTPEPTVVVEDDGEVAFEWHRNARHTFSVSVGRDGTLRFAGLFGHRSRSGVDQLVGRIPNDILRSISLVGLEK